MKTNSFDYLINLQNESPSEYANRLGTYYISTVTNEHKKLNGQFFTPIEIARFMASFCKLNKEKIKILDPGCGIGILSTTLIEHIVINFKKIKAIELIVFETDLKVLPLTEKCYEYLRVWLTNKKIDFTIFICTNDFILHNSPVLNNQESEVYDIIISNPPYFKLSKKDERAIVAKSMLFGQANIYSIFLLISAKLLKQNGHLIFITPRSFCSGSYFKKFRELFFSIVDLSEIHLFNSRKSAFKKDKVLQENIIISAYRQGNKKRNNEVTVSTSIGLEDIESRQEKIHHISGLINLQSSQKILHLPLSETDESIIKIFNKWTGSLTKYNLDISTGPVVDFRSEEMIRTKESKNTVPLIWLHNVEPMNFVWPKNTEYKGKLKGQYIINDKSSISRLVKNRNYVLLRRFSTKDDNRRLVASPYFKSNLANIQMLGIENHMNYIYHKKSELTIDQTIGLAAILNSKLFDLYFRTFNGNINVSATELRDFPLPDFHLIQLLGQKIKAFNKIRVPYLIDDLVSETFNLSIDLSKAYA